MEFSKEGGIFNKATLIASSLFGTLICASRLLYPMQIPKPFPPLRNLQPQGLKTLIHSQTEPPPQKPTHIHSYMITSPPSTQHSSSSPPPSTCPSPHQSLTHSSSYSSCSTVVGDMIGTESGHHVSSNPEELFLGLDNNNNSNKTYQQRYGKEAKRRRAVPKEYPPPIPSLARVGNPPGHVPKWILTREYTNGKLILRKHRVKHPDYLEARRENGRLILNLVRVEEDLEIPKDKNVAQHDKKTETLKDDDCDKLDQTVEKAGDHEASMVISGSPMPRSPCVDYKGEIYGTSPIEFPVRPMITTVM